MFLYFVFNPIKLNNKVFYNEIKIKYAIEDKLVALDKSNYKQNSKTETVHLRRSLFK